jgi:Fe2+ or Zn2+ uptake regulation protein
MIEYECTDCNDTGELPNGEACPKCCKHSEHDHFICLDCGHEGEPSDYYDEDAGQDR